MKVLGITQTNHGSSAALYDGKTLLACNEERFDRIKFSSGFPFRSINWCLQEGRTDMEQVDAIGFYMTSGHFLRTIRSNRTNSWRFYPETLYTILGEILKKTEFISGEDIQHIHQSVRLFNGKKIDLFFIDHHLAHAAGSFLVSGFDSSAILCIDGTGDGCSMSWGIGKDRDVKLTFRQPFPHSLGQFYGTFTQFLGFQANSDEYRAMGLAAYGDSEVYYDQVRQLITLHDDGSFELDMRYFSFHMTTETQKFNQRLINLMRLEPNVDVYSISKDYCDLAAAVQLVTEDVLRHVLCKLKAHTGESTLCYGGGVALNCLANGNVIRECGFDDYYVMPNPGDSGLAVGTGVYLIHQLEGVKREYVYDQDYLGPIFSADEIKRVLDENGLSYTEPPLLEQTIAEKISEGLVMGHLDGRQEFGPRALGNRSIFADPRYTEMKDNINKKIKFREPFRPFAPSCLSEKARSVFSMRNAKLRPSSPESFMTTTAKVCEKWQTNLQAITHEDGTARLQTVFSEKNLKFHKIISEFEKLTGVPVLLNTSFNIKGEPIVLSPQDAIRCFYTTGMDSLVMGPFLLEKN